MYSTSKHSLFRQDTFYIRSEPTSRKSGAPYLHIWTSVTL